MLEHDLYATLDLNKNQLFLIIQMVADSIKNHPEQFTFDINVQVIGTKISSTGNAPGLIATAIGGASGSQAIGYSSTVTMNNSKIEITRKQAEKEFLQQMRELSEKLAELAILIKNGSTKGKMEEILTTIKGWKWVPEIILALVNLVHTCL